MAVAGAGRAGPEARAGHAGGPVTFKFRALGSPAISPLQDGAVRSCFGLTVSPSQVTVFKFSRAGRVRVRVTVVRRASHGTQRVSRRPAN